MILFYNNSGDVVGSKDENFSQKFSIDEVTGQIDVPKKLANRFRDIEDPLHASMCSVKNDKIVLPKIIEEANSVDIGI